MDKNDKKHDDKADKKQKADKNNPKKKAPIIAGGVAVPSAYAGKKAKKTY